MLKVSKFYGEDADGDVLEWKVKSSKPYKDGEDKMIRYVVSVSPYAIDWDSEYIDAQSNPNAGTVEMRRNW